MPNSSVKAQEPGEAGRLFREGDLTAALAAATDAVRKAPTDVGARILLAELLVFTGNLERTDVVLDACGDLDPSAALIVAEFRQLVRGERARRQLFSDGRVPEFLGEPTAAQRHALAAVVAQRSGDAAEAARLVAQAEGERVHPRGASVPGGAFDDMRDADDILGPAFEVITTTGKYYWVSPAQILTIEMHPMKRPRDLFWRRATMQVAGGPDGDVYLPMIYPPLPDAREAPTDAQRLGRATAWEQLGDGGPTRGVGAVTMVVGEDAMTWLELTKVDFEVAA